MGKWTRKRKGIQSADGSNKIYFVCSDHACTFSGMGTGSVRSIPVPDEIVSFYGNIWVFYLLWGISDRGAASHSEEEIGDAAIRNLGSGMFGGNSGICDFFYHKEAVAGLEAQENFCKMADSAPGGHCRGGACNICGVCRAFGGRKLGQRLLYGDVEHVFVYGYDVPV
jgi:hypothetical protein